ncbi:MAG: rod shape-determining protein MreC [Gemmatimonadetes bacterium]|nr:rod shape-determining protein MreC [Gemmatimonadota bacterium]
MLRPVLALQQGAVERDVRFADPVRLRAERDSLAVYLVGHATLASENRQLRSLLGLRQRLPPSFIPAEAVRVPGRGYEGFFLLTAGSADGLRPGAPIISAAGLVGMVRNADEQMAMAIDWTHPDFRASAMTVDGETFGIVEPRSRGGAEPMLALTGTAFHTELPQGAVIVTAGRGGVYPRGIPIGTVVGMEDEEEGWRRSYLLQPFVGPGEMTHVLVLGDPQATIDQDLALSWGIRPPEPPPVDTAQLAATPPATVRTPAAPRQPTPQIAAPAPRAPPAPTVVGTPVQQRPQPGDTTPAGRREE